MSHNNDVRQIRGGDNGCKNNTIQAFATGARFKYVGGTDVWCVLQRGGCGVIAKWEGNILQFSGQLICSAGETEAATDDLRVILLPDNAQMEVK